MADIEFVESEYGDTYVITIKDPDGNDANLTAYTGANLLINSMDLATNKTNATLTISSPTVIWSMTSGDTDYNGTFVAQVQLTGSSITKTTKLMSVLAFKKLAS
tara:strand:+ start:132 stop:443 length:312 start_codon:yes stop_codon:yes gene_type:complete